MRYTCSKEDTTLTTIGGISLEKELVKTHETHCCAIHGCKYNEEDCPVVSKEIKQQYLCPDCHETFNDMDDVVEILLVQNKIKELRAKGESEITIRLDVLERLMDKN